jgi:RimJ/RimL family protein N-acetyltransferase
VVALTTSRLNLRRMTSDDLPAVSAMNADAEVMRYFPACLTTAQSAEFIDRVDACFDRHGLGWLAVEWRDTGEFAGCVGLLVPAFDAPFTPCVEVGWRLCRRYWGLGVATEAASVVLDWGFGAHSLDEILAYTYAGNAPSRRVMEKLGMSRDANGDFEHPRLEVGHRLRPHVLYRLRRDEFASRGDVSE